MVPGASGRERGRGRVYVTYLSPWEFIDRALTAAKGGLLH
jgi:hypothetical protein